MPLTRQNAQRLLHFCLGPDDSGSVDLGSDGAALVIVSPAESSAGVRTFEAATFDAALRQAVVAGLLKAACVEKQIAFLAQDPPPSARREAAGSAARTPRDLFPRLVGATAMLLHETQVERGMSAILVASSGRYFRRDLARQRARTDAARDQLTRLRQELAGPLGTILSRRFDRAGAKLNAIETARLAIDGGGITPGEIVGVYSAANAELLGIGDGALVAFAPEPRHAGALAAVVLLYAKEKIGIERARLGAAFVSRSFSEDDRQALAGLLAARRSYLHIFSTTAPRPAEELLERALASATYTDLSRTEDLILAGREEEIALDARGWFNLASRKIELLGEIGAATLGLMAAG
jgi:hypothetical protein